MSVTTIIGWGYGEVHRAYLPSQPEDLAGLPCLLSLDSPI